MNILNLIKIYIPYLLSSRSPGRAGLPLPADIFSKQPLTGFIDPVKYEAYEKFRDEMLSNKTKIDVTDYGSGESETYKRSIASIASKSSQQRKYTELQCRLIHYLKPSNILEMGTSLGLTTSLFAMTAPEAQIITMEGCNNTADRAGELFHKLDLSNITMIRGEFDKTIDKVYKRFGKMDYIYFDGNHRMIPTLNYFLKALSHSYDHSVFVFDDITWSDDMQNAWFEINKHPGITLSLDLFTVGILMFDKGFQKKKITLRY